MSYRPKAAAASLLAATLLALPPTLTEAQETPEEDRVYLAVSYARPTLETPYGEATPPATILKLGILSPHVGAELRAGFGAGDDTDEGGFAYETTSYVGLFGRINFVSAATSPVIPYVLFGYNSWETDIPAVADGKLEGSGGAYGVGIDIKVIDAMALNLEYSKWFTNVDTLAFGVKWFF